MTFDHRVWYNFLGFDFKFKIENLRAKRVGHRKQKICIWEEILNFLDVGGWLFWVWKTKGGFKICSIKGDLLAGSGFNFPVVVWISKKEKPSSGILWSNFILL